MRARRLPGKLFIAVSASICLLCVALAVENSNSAASAPPRSYGWQPVTIYLPQVSTNISAAEGRMTATYHFAWNQTYDFSTLNWSTVDRSKTGQKYILGLGVKVWVVDEAVGGPFPIEITQGDGTSLDYSYEYTSGLETPHIYLTGERTYWRWDRAPNAVYDYHVKGSCALEDAWRNGTWTPEEGIALEFSPTGTLVLGSADFAMQLFVFDVLVPEFDSLPLMVVLVTTVLLVARERRLR